MTSTPAAPVEIGQLQVAAAGARAYGDALSETFLERRNEIRGLLLATIARQHVLLLGPPGTAKSDLTNAYAAGLGWTSFVRLLGRTTVPEELFGPLSLQKLKADVYERKVDGYLPTAEVAFVDEIFKGSSAILNSLLTALNERAFDNGTQRVRVPLRICVGASNELPQEDGLGALYDRFLLRYWVDYLADDSSFETLLTRPRGAMPTLAPVVVDTLSTAARDVDLRPVIPAILAIRTKLREERLVISDRRWKQASGLVQASAVLDGRATTVSRDLAVLCDCLWDRPEHRDLIRGVVAKLRNPAVAKAETLLLALREIIARAPKTPKQDELPAVSSALNEATKIGQEAKDLDEATSDEEVKEILKSLRREGQAFRKVALSQTNGIAV